MIDRDVDRIKQTGEIFTPFALVNEILEKLVEQDNTLFNNDPENTFLDPAAGDGNFLTQVYERKVTPYQYTWASSRKPKGRKIPISNTINTACTPEEALNTIFGVDLMPDNVMLCRTRLLLASQNMDYSESTSSQIVTAREQEIMYILYRMAGAPHDSLMIHHFDSENTKLQDYINPDVSLLTEERYPTFGEFKDFVMQRLNKSYDTARTEYYVLRNSNERKVGKNLNLLKQMNLVKIVFNNIVCADSLNGWNFEEWKPKSLPPQTAPLTNFFDEKLNSNFNHLY